MNHRFSFLVVLSLSFSLITLTGCGGDNPTKAVKTFQSALEKEDMEMLESVTTTECYTMLDMGLKMAKSFGMPNTTKSQTAEQGKIKSYSHTITGDTAVVKITFDNGKSEEMPLKKVDGKWKVNLPTGNGNESFDRTEFEEMQQQMQQMPQIPIPPMMPMQ
jgi:hypothetical protein